MVNIGNAPEKDVIKADLVQKGGENMARLIHFVFQQVLEKGLIPHDWRDAILVSLFKKGPKDSCDNYHEISLLSVIGQLFARVLLNRLHEHIAPNVLPEYQCGFRSNLGMMDMIFIVWQLQEKCHKQGLY